MWPVNLLTTNFNRVTVSSASIVIVSMLIVDGANERVTRGAAFATR